MKTNTTYTALEVLKELNTNFKFGEEEYTPEEVFGKGRIVIAGIRGIVDPKDLIKIQSKTTKLNIVVGVKAYELKVEADDEEYTITEEAQKVKEEQKPTEIVEETKEN